MTGDDDETEVAGTGSDATLDCDAAIDLLNDATFDTVPSDVCRNDLRGGSRLRHFARRF